MRRGLLLLVTSVAGTVVGAVVLAACLPATPATPAASPTSTTRSATTTTTDPGGGGGGGWAQNGSLGTCTVFPADNAWNRDVSTLPADTNSANYLSAIAGLGGNQQLHADFGGAGVYGIPYITVPGNQAKLPIDFTDDGDESDPGPYPIPTDVAGRERQRRARPRGRPRPLQALRTVRRESGYRSLVGGVGRDVRPHVERTAAGGVDVG